MPELLLAAKKFGSRYDVTCDFLHTGAGFDSVPAAREGIEQFCQALLVRITHGAVAICIDPFGMLHPQVTVNLLQQRAHSGLRGGRCGCRSVVSSIFHKRFYCVTARSPIGVSAQVADLSSTNAVRVSMCDDLVAFISLLPPSR